MTLPSVKTKYTGRRSPNEKESKEKEKQCQERFPDLNVSGGVPAPKPDIVHRPFHLALYPGIVRWTGHRLETVMLGKMGKLDIKGRMPAFPVDHHMLHVVIEHIHGNLAQVVKSVDMDVHEGLQVAAVDEHGKHGPGESQDQDEQINRETAAAVEIGHLEVCPVHLTLETGNRLEADIGFALEFVF